MSSRIFGAEEAVRLDLIAGLATPEALDVAIEAEVAPYLACAPGAVAAAKRLARRLGPAIGQSEIEASIQDLIESWQGEEAQEGIVAFFDRRKPRWQPD